MPARLGMTDLGGVFTWRTGAIPDDPPPGDSTASNVWVPSYISAPRHIPLRPIARVGQEKKNIICSVAPSHVQIFPSPNIKKKEVHTWF